MIYIEAALPLSRDGVRVYASDKNLVATVNAHGALYGLSDLIVKAVNDHALLVQTLQTARTLLSDPTPFNVLEASHLINKTIAEVEK